MGIFKNIKKFNPETKQILNILLASWELLESSLKVKQINYIIGFVNIISPSLYQLILNSGDMKK